MSCQLRYARCLEAEPASGEVPIESYRCRATTTGNVHLLERVGCRFCAWEWALLGGAIEPIDSMPEREGKAA